MFTKVNYSFKCLMHRYLRLYYICEQHFGLGYRAGIHKVLEFIYNVDISVGKFWISVLFFFIEELFVHRLFVTERLFPIFRYSAGQSWIMCWLACRLLRLGEGSLLTRNEWVKPNKGITDSVSCYGDFLLSSGMQGNVILMSLLVSEA